MDYLGLVLELLFLALGVYVYLFALGKIKFKDPTTAQKAEQFRLQNKGWMRILSIALIAIMALEISIHFYQLFSS